MSESFRIGDDEFRLEPANFADPFERNAILATWIRTFAGIGTSTRNGSRVPHASMGDPMRPGSRWADNFGKQLVADTHDRVILGILERPTTSVRVIRAAEVPTSVLAWICDEGDTLHYVCCKMARYRRLGFATRLMAGRLYTMHTHETYAWEHAGIQAGAYYPAFSLGKKAA